MVDSDPMSSPLSFDNFRPTELVTSGSLEALLNLVSQLQPGLEFEAEGLDFVFRHRVLRAIRAARPDADSVASLTELAAVLRRAAVTHDSRLLDGFKIPCATRWKSYSALLDAQADAVESLSPDALRKLEHVDAILDVVVNDGPFETQDELLAEVQRRSPTIQKSSLSRLLTRLEEAEYVTRRKIGRRQKIEIGPNCPVKEFLRERKPRSAKIRASRFGTGNQALRFISELAVSASNAPSGEDFYHSLEKTIAKLRAEQSSQEAVGDTSASEAQAVERRDEW
jgi:hypothetical protein